MKLNGLLSVVTLLGVCVMPIENDGPLKVGITRARSTSQTSAPTFGVERAYGQLPLSFEVIEHAGGAQARAVARSRGFTFELMGSGAVITIGKGNPRNAETVHMRVLGGSPHPKVSGSGPLRGRTNYLIGDDPKLWRIGVPNFERVSLHNVYPGIDLTYYGREGDLEYDFVVAPGSSPGRIRMAFTGARRLRLDNGDLLLRMGEGELRLHSPFVYQLRNGKKVPVLGRFALVRRNEVSFQIGDYDPRSSLVIDPGLIYSSYLGGSGRDEVLGIAVAKDGSAYVIGSTTSIDFPVSPSGFQEAIGHSSSTVFITKLNPSGSAIEYSTYLGGSHRNIGTAIAANDNGEAYVTGSTQSADFPITPGAVQLHNAGGMDAFIARLSADGSHLVYSTYLGGSDEDEARGLALDGSGNVFIAGFTRSGDFPTDSPSKDVRCGAEACRQAFIARVNATGTAIDYATTIGGSGHTSANGIALDLSGAAYITGDTSAPDFPTSKGAFQTHASDHNGCEEAGRQCSDAFVAKLSSQGAFLYATYVGGDRDQHANAIAVDNTGSAYVTGGTDSDDFPTTSAPFRDVAPIMGVWSFVFKLDPFGSKLEYSVFPGGHQKSEGKAIALDSATHDAYVSGWTSSLLFPTTADAFQHRFIGKSAGFLSRLDDHGVKVGYSSLLGGSGSDVAAAVALDSAGNIYVAGSTDSFDFPLRKPVQGSLVGERNAFVAKFSVASTVIGPVSSPVVPSGAPTVTLSATSLQFLNQQPGTKSTPQTVTLKNSGTANLTNIVLAIVGANATDFSVVTIPSTNCGGTLTVGATCTVTVAFKPITTGVRTAMINIADDAATSPQTVALTGNPPVASVSTTSLSFASQPEGSLSAYQTVTLKNTAAYSSLNVSGISLSGGNFQQANSCVGTLGTNASCVVTVAFMPSATGTLDADLNFADNSLDNPVSMQTVALSGVATGAPVASLSTTSVNFGTLPQGTKSAVQTVTLTNTGIGTLTISNVYLTAADSFTYSTGSGSCSVTPSLKKGASCTVSITFYANPGIQPSTLLITDNSGNLAGTVQEVSLVGTGETGIYNGQFSATILNFGSVQMGSAGVHKIVQFKNTGTVPLSFSATSLFTDDHYDYEVQPASSNGCGAIKLAVGASCNIAIIFNPALGSPGLRTATLSITAAAPYFTKAMYLSGIATGQAVPTLSTTGVMFGSVNVGSSSSAKTVVLKNTGNEPLTTGGLSVSGSDFVVVPASTNNCAPSGGTNLLPGTSCNISVAFEPRTAGTLSELLTLFSNTGGSPGIQLYVALTGTGQSTTPGPTVTMSTNTLNFGNQQAGTASAAQSITMTNSGTIPWYISTFSSGSYLIESPCNSYINPGDSCVVDVYFIPTLLGPQPYSASLELLTSATPSNLMLVFNGTGVGNLAAGISTSTLNLGAATSGSLGTSGQVTFTNTGNVPYPLGNVGLMELNPVGIGSSPDFQQTNDCQFAPSGLMPIGASCSVLVTFTPAVGLAGPRQSLLTLSGGSVGSSVVQQIVIVNGTATGNPVLSVSPLSFTFLDQTQGTSSSPLALRISNVGTAPLPLGVTFGGSEFPSISYDCPEVLEQGTSCLAYFAFNPDLSPSFGPRLSSVIVSNSIGSQQQLVPVSGFGTPP